MNLDARGVPQPEAATISDRLRHELLRTRKFRVMEREKVDQILLEQGFQQTGACSEVSCLVEAGQLIGVGHMIGGSIGRVGRRYAIALKMINVETAEIEKSVIQDSDRPIEDVLVVDIRIIAEKMAGLLLEEGAELLAGTCELLVKTRPDGARVTVEGVPAVGERPLTVERVRPGKHLEERLNGHHRHHQSNPSKSSSSHRSC